MASNDSGRLPPRPLGEPASGEAPLSDLIGRMIGGYQVERLVGRGGMGAVFEAVHPYIERSAAIKVLHPELSQNPQFSARFLNEARAVNLVHHPGLVQIFEFGVLPEGIAYIVMEFLHGETLSARLDRSPGQSLPEPQALDVVRQVAAALQAAHDKDIVHRDLKPENVMVIADPERRSGERCKILDFGVAKMTSRPGEADVTYRTHAGMALGTPEYMSPEQCIGSPTVDGKADVYALGVMLFQMLSGQLPFTGALPFDIMAAHVRTPPPALRQLYPGVAAPLDRLVHAMLSKDPALRPTMRQIVLDLERLGAPPSIESAGVSGRAPGIPEKGASEPVLINLMPTLPLDDLSHSRTEPQTPAPAAGRPRVLVVDDEPDLARTLCSMLEGEGLSCHVVHDGALVMDALRRFRPDLVVLDVELPSKSGYKLCWEIKSSPDSALIPVILLSAKDQETDHKLGMAMQADAYVAKPFDFNELLAVIQLVLSRPG